MFQKRMWQLCGLAIAMSSGAVALGQSSSSGTSLNQMALKNAQQAMQQSFSQTQSQTGMQGGGRIGIGLGNSYSGSKPFSGFSQGPTVSPYLNLFRIDQNGQQGFNYSTLVAPELRQQQVNKQQQSQNNLTTSRLQAISAQADYNMQGSKEAFPTGHQTVFQYMGHYYPQQRQRQKKQAR